MSDLYAELLAERFGPTWRPTRNEQTTAAALLEAAQADDELTTARRRAVLAEAYRETAEGHVA